MRLDGCFGRGDLVDDKPPRAHLLAADVLGEAVRLEEHRDVLTLAGVVADKQRVSHARRRVRAQHLGGDVDRAERDGAQVARRAVGQLARPAVVDLPLGADVHREHAALVLAEGDAVFAHPLPVLGPDERRVEAEQFDHQPIGRPVSRLAEVAPRRRVLERRRGKPLELALRRRAATGLDVRLALVMVLEFVGRARDDVPALERRAGLLGLLVRGQQAHGHPGAQAVGLIALLPAVPLRVPVVGDRLLDPGEARVDRRRDPHLAVVAAVLEDAAVRPLRDDGGLAGALRALD